MVCEILRDFASLVPAEDLGDLPAAARQRTHLFLVAVVEYEVLKVAHIAALKHWQDDQKLAAVRRELGRRVLVHPSVRLADFVFLSKFTTLKEVTGRREHPLTV